MRKATVLLTLSLAAGGASADVLYGAQIKKLYAQSRQGSDAHLIQISQSLSACHANRLYIDFADKELFAAALAAYLAEKSVDLIYSTTASPRTAAGHLAGLQCRVISIF